MITESKVTSTVPILARIAGWTLVAAIVVLSIVPPNLRPETDLPHALEHFAIFWATGVAFALGYSLSLTLATVLVIFSGAVEIIQLVIPGRHARLSDFIVDALATVMGLLTVSLIAQIRKHTRA